MLFFDFFIDSYINIDLDLGIRLMYSISKNNMHMVMVFLFFVFVLYRVPDHFTDIRQWRNPNMYGWVDRPNPPDAPFTNMG